MTTVEDRALHGPEFSGPPQPARRFLGPDPTQPAAPFNPNRPAEFPQKIGLPHIFLQNDIGYTNHEIYRLNDFIFLNYSLQFDQKHC